MFYFFFLILESQLSYHHFVNMVGSFPYQLGIQGKNLSLSASLSFSLCMCACACIHPWGLERVSDPLELELQATVRHLVCELASAGATLTSGMNILNWNSLWANILVTGCLDEVPWDGLEQGKFSQQVRLQFPQLCHHKPTEFSLLCATVRLTAQPALIRGFSKALETYSFQHMMWKKLRVHYRESSCFKKNDQGHDNLSLKRLLIP